VGGRRSRGQSHPGAARALAREVRHPKSRRSRRAIDLAPTLKAALARLPSRFKGELVFTSPTGEAIDPDNFSHRDWVRALRRSQLRRIRFHDLRHTYASLLIAQGAHPRHLMPEMHAAEARKLDRLVFGQRR
jgi:integrase